MRIERLVTMANDIGAFFDAEPDKSRGRQECRQPPAGGSGIHACGVKSSSTIGVAGWA